ncbi:trypsin-like serine protease [Kitasatospora sp. NPDC015120]|uniref:trypsin-like serine protease n=1 Tax=Kitasatospora sp. NPDC015120 TaxID=3364023 RepID=UPI0036F45D3D
MLLLFTGVLLRTIRGVSWPLSMVLAIPVIAGSVPAASAAEPTPPPAAVEDFIHPGAAKILADRGITLKAGDGHIRLAECDSSSNLVRLYSRAATPSLVCFEITGPTGYLALEIPHIYNIKGDDHTVKARINTSGNTTEFQLDKDNWTPIGEGSGGVWTTLLELSAIAGPEAPKPPSDNPAVGIVTVGQPGRVPGAKACTATLVNRFWALSASSCFTDNPAALGKGAPPIPSTAVFGARSVGIAELVPYSGRDLVMARLATPVEGITPVRLSSAAPAVGESLRIPGYGRTANEWLPSSLHTTTHTVDAVTASGLDTAPVAGHASLCAGDAGAPLLRTRNGSVELAGLASRSWQGGCLGSTEARTGASSTRTDDITAWINATRHTTATGTFVTGTPFVITDPVDNHLVTYLQDSAGHLWSVDPQDEGWVDHGAFAAAPPTAAVDPATGRVVVHVNGPDNRLWSFDERNGTKWTKFDLTPRGTALAPNAVPRTIVDPADNHLVTFVRDTDNRLWSVDPQDEGWTDVFPGAPIAATDPVPIINPNDQHITLYFNGPNNKLNSLSLPDRTRTEFQLTPAATALAPDAVPSTVVDPVSKHFVTFVRDTANHLWSVDPLGAGWVDHGWNPGDAMAATDPVAIVNPLTNHITVFVNGPDNDLFSFDLQGGGQHNGWTRFNRTWAGTSMAANAVPFPVVDPADNHLTTFIRDTNSTLWAVDPAAEGWTPYDGGPSAP